MGIMFLEGHDPAYEGHYVPSKDMILLVRDIMF